MKINSQKENAEKKNSATAKQNTVDKQDGLIKEAYIRVLAEFENYKSRSQKEQLSWIRQANKKLLQELIPILDDFERALATAETAEKGQEGMQLIYQKFCKVLTAQGLKPLPTKIGDPFNPEIHNALATVPNTDEKKRDKIAQIVHKGYQLNEETIRFAEVIVNA